MTMKPKAKKFRIRRNGAQPAGIANDHAEAHSASSSAGSAGAEANMGQAPVTQQPATPSNSGTPPAAHPQPTQSAETNVVDHSVATSINEIRKEGLTGRQLRMARRIAQKHGLAPTSDFDAVRLLRAKGVDPFERSGVLDLVAPSQTGVTVGAGQQQPARSSVQLPQTVPPKPQTLPVSPESEISPADRRASEIMDIQRDIGRRRRRKLALLFSRLCAFVLLPTLIVGWYFYNIATPMYSSKSEFLILTADGAGGGVSSFFQGTSFATGQDSIATQSYLQSKDAMLRLDRDLGFRAHFSQDSIDSLQRLPPEATNEEVFKVYKKYIQLGYDPTEGVIKMEVSTADPAVSALFSAKLIEYAEERVDELSQEKREDAVAIAEDGLNEAKQERRNAQQALVELQEESILDPEGEIAGIRSLISNVELQLQEKELALETQLNNRRPNTSKVDALRSEIAILQVELDRQKARLTEATEGDTSLASKTVAISMAQADLAQADLVMASALEAKRIAEVEAIKQVRYLTVSVKPLASEAPSYPRKFENTLVAFLIFIGIYMMISLTASILREQVSS